jgi:hypothetical protein
MSDTQTAVRSALTWFEIPNADFDRARRFYETIFETSLAEHAFDGARIAIFPSAGEGVGGCLDAGSEAKPGDAGVVIYLDALGRFDRTLGLVEGAGGRIVSPKRHLPEIGYVAQILDSEGNRIGLHSKT